MRLRGLDLNLLLVLDALLALRSVTAAAQKLNVTQPTMSGSLARLREHFEDQLLARAGQSMELTPLGEMLRLPVREALERAELVVTMRPEFDPAHGIRHFNMSASDGTLQSLLVDVVQEAARRAPGITLRVTPPDPVGMLDRLRRHQLDFIFTIDGTLLPDHPTALVICERFVCIAWKGNRRVRKGLTMPLFMELGHAVARFGDAQVAGSDQRALEAAGIQRREEVVCTTPLMLGPLITGTERIATLPTRLAQRQAAIFPLTLMEPPMDLPPLQIIMQWHRSREQDGATVWMRDLVLEIVRRNGLIEGVRADA
jgi:LysR family nod box-dependent transcriptional activator